MEYSQISKFLEKFKQIIYKKEEIKEIVTKTISQTVSHQFDKKLIKIKGSFIYIEASPIVRSEILIYKKEILNNLKEVLPNNIFLDIK